MTRGIYPMTIDLTSAVAPRVPSPEADRLVGHLHGWLYRICHEERRPTPPGRHLTPFAAWPMAVAERGLLRVRVSWFEEGYAHRAIATLARERAALLGAAPFAVSAIRPLAYAPVGPDQLMDAAADAPALELRTVTPVVFRRHSRTHVTLDPIEVLRSAEDRWQRIWPGTLPYATGLDSEQALQAMARSAWDRWHRIPVGRLEARTVRRDVGEFVEFGVVGAARYELHRIASVEHRRLALALLRGAELFGLGSRVAYGFGGIFVAPQAQEAT